MRVMHVVGARPNFVKTAPILAAMSQHPETFEQLLVHTGQHYDENMSGVFFGDLHLPVPDELLNVGSGTHAEQTARVMLAFEPVLLKHQPDWVMVVGDVNSTVASALVAAKRGIRVAHVEAGLRSGDRRMPEEINRILTDQLSDALFTPSRDCDANLGREGVEREKIHFVGNVMIDTLVRLLPEARRRTTLSDLHLAPGGYILATVHRPSNVDDLHTLGEILAALDRLDEILPVLFPVHPRTRQRIASLNDPTRGSRVRWTEPLGYLDFLAVMSSAALVLTDSGGIQEETTYLGVPCLTARPNTERPITIQAGTNRLVASTCEAILTAAQEIMSSERAPVAPPEFWDGSAAKRLVDIMRRWERNGASDPVERGVLGTSV